MKKKNVLMMALSLCLVAVIAVGGTLAYLTASDDAVVNNFQFVSGDGDGNVITVELTEADPNSSATIKLGTASATSNTKGGYDYTNVVPGQKLPKAPSVSATAYIDSYVFVKIDPSADVAIDEINWNEVPGKENVYYKEVKDNDGVAENLGTIFDSVTVTNEFVEGKELESIKIQVAAIAKGNLTVEQAAQAVETDGVYRDYQG